MRLGLSAPLWLAHALSFASLASAEPMLTSSSFRLHGAFVVAASRASSESATVSGAGASLPASVLGTSTGLETGLVLVGGLWPALVGAAFDQDRDLRADVTDNCTLVRNTLQVDVDVDGYGNACDPDLTNDDIVNFADMARLKAVFFRRDPLADLNGDGVVNFVDLAIMKQTFFKAPGPSAGKP